MPFLNRPGPWVHSAVVTDVSTKHTALPWKAVRPLFSGLSFMYVLQSHKLIIPSPVSPQGFYPLEVSTQIFQQPGLPFLKRVDEREDLSCSYV